VPPNAPGTIRPLPPWEPEGIVRTSVLKDAGEVSALRRFTTRNIDELPILDPESEGKVLGMVRRKDVIALYNRRLVEEKQRRTD